MYAERTGYYRSNAIGWLGAGTVAWLGSAEYKGRKAHDECLPDDQFEEREDRFGKTRMQKKPWCWLGRGAQGYDDEPCAFCGAPLGGDPDTCEVT